MGQRKDVASAMTPRIGEGSSAGRKRLPLRLSGAGWRQAAFGFSVFVLGGAAAMLTSRFPVGFSYDSAGPRLFPGLVAAGLMLSGLCAVTDAVTSPASQDDEEYDLLPVALIAGTLLVQIFILKWAGWPPTAAMVFAVTAWVMGSRNLLRDLAIGLGFGIVTLLVFNVGLGLNLPLGVIAGLFPAG
ncbi:tripartite tricarboxylate transporter TctB family protein [Ancylobacter oerskovii]|uniref:Tripartite tricarboxylate transporter TctB family protein n=2 Tax=Ancylobacter oerskovii TaxID=459519 RepID=A0ABW4YZR4_9HYPH